MVQHLARLPALEVWGPVFNPMPGQLGVQFLFRRGQSPETLHFLLFLSIAQTLGEITLKSFLHISYHHMHMQKSSPSICLSSLKKGEPFFKKENQKPI